MNIYQHIASNKQKTYLMMFVFILLAAGVAYLFGEASGYGSSIVGVALVISGFTSFASYYWSDKIILSLSHARPADPKRDFDFFTVAENIAIAAGLPKPKLYVIDDPSPNAFATGRDPKHAVIVATTGLLQRLERSEIEGVIAHEMAHVQNYDIRMMSVVAVLSGVIVLITDIFMRQLWWGGMRNRDNNRGGGIILALSILAAILAPIVATLIKLAVSRRREFLADASGAYLTRNPGELASALEKISADPQPLRSASSATAHLYIENPFKVTKSKNWYVSMFNTHPPVEERIKRLKSM
ncbi:MAG TPA: M48 family metalloprotease [Patescibacteria group bacterium]|nr:M48 family metalloprotease [Patescibacteria group bacterium]